MVDCKIMKLSGEGLKPVKAKIINQMDLTSDCWSVQIWGLPYCSGFGDPNKKCGYLATDECGGYRIRKMILSGKYPVNGLPDVSPE